MLVYIAAFVIGLALSVVWAWYIRTVVEKSPWRAALSDGILLTLTFAQYQIWAARHNDISVFAVIIAGSMLGTYFYIWWNNVQHRRHMALLDRDRGECEEAASTSRRFKTAAIRRNVRPRAEAVSTHRDLRRGSQSAIIRGPQNPPCA